MHRNWTWRAAAILAATAVAALAYAPHVPRLWWEGQPADQWPAPGSFAHLAGGDGATLPISRLLTAPNDKLKQMFEDSGGRALLAARGGRIVIERYAEGFSRDSRLNSYSMAKSLVGALTLKAMAEGRISSREVAVATLMPELRGSKLGTLPLCRLLDMRSGLDFEIGTNKQVSGFALKDLEDSKYAWLSPMARLHMQGLARVSGDIERSSDGDTAPDCGKGRFNYQNVNTAIVGAMLERAYGRPLQDLIAEKIWQPAGAAPAEWRRYGPQLAVTPYCCIYARPMDWLLVAQYLADNGKPGAPFLPQPLWRELLGYDVAPGDLRAGHYGDFTFHASLSEPDQALQGRFTYFLGARGQVTYLMPQERLIAVRFGSELQPIPETLAEIGNSIGISERPTQVGWR